jgi:endoglucanase
LYINAFIIRFFPKFFKTVKQRNHQITTKGDETVRTTIAILATFALVATADTLLWPKNCDDIKPWKSDRFASWTQVDDTDTPILKVHLDPNESIPPGVLGASMPFDLTPYRGKEIELTVHTKHENLVKASRGWLGFKFMLSYKSEGMTHYPAGGGGDNVPRNSDWRIVSFSIRVPSDATMGNLQLGIQATTGTIWFKNASFKEVNLFPDVVELPDDFKCEYSDAVKNLPIMRGAMSPSLHNGAKAEDLHELASWGANVIRWQINIPKEEVNDIELCKKRLQTHIKNLDVHIKQLREDGLQVIFDFHQAPGGRLKATQIAGTAGLLAGNVAVDGNHFRMFYDKAYLDAFVEMWQVVARHYKNEPIVVAYDLINEPAQSGVVPYDYLYCQYQAAKAIREIDPEKPIIIAANAWSSAPAFKYLKPLPLKNLIYQGHMYEPGDYTHQGVGGNNMNDLKTGKTPFKTYPGRLAGTYWDQNTMRKALNPILKFQQQYGARIYMGEFSAIRFAPGAEQYLSDLIDIFEEYKWDWSYHAFREWHNWSVEYDENIHNDKPATQDTNRKKLLLKHFKKNIKPKEPFKN